MTRRPNPENDGLEAAIRELLTEGLSQGRIAKRLSVTRGRVTHIIYYRIRRTKVLRFAKPFNGLYTDAKLTEPWTEYTARKQKERAEAKAAAPQVALTGQDSD